MGRPPAGCVARKLAFFGKEEGRKEPWSHLHKSFSRPARESMGLALLPASVSNSGSGLVQFSAETE